MITHAAQPQVNTLDEPPLYFLGLPTRLRATGATTNGAFGLLEQVMPPGFASPYHTHQLEDEAFYVLEGEMAFVCAGTWTRATAGTYIFGPRQIPHGFKVVGESPARMLLLCAPGGFDQFVVEMSEQAPAPPDMAKLMATAAKYRVDIHGPLPEEPPISGSRIASPESSLMDAVDRLRARHIAAVNAGDVDATLAVFAPDACVLAAGQPILRGAALRSWFTGMFAAAAVQDFALQPTSTERYGSVVVEDGTWSATLQSKNGSPGQPVGGAYVTTYARLADGDVRVISDSFDGLAG
jgi:quercetin dioxygenase-like cupin family protein/ketosteroid isomerase-like protein